MLDPSNKMEKKLQQKTNQTYLGLCIPKHEYDNLFWFQKNIYVAAYFHLLLPNYCWNQQWWISFLFSCLLTISTVKSFKSEWKIIMLIDKLYIFDCVLTDVRYFAIKFELMYQNLKGERRKFSYATKFAIRK